VREFSDIHDGAGLNGPETQFSGAGEEVRRLGAGVEPEFAHVAAAGEVVEDSHADFGRHVEQGAVDRAGSRADRRIGGKPLHLDFVGIDRQDGVALAAIGADGFVAELAPIGAGAEDGNGRLAGVRNNKK